MFLSGFTILLFDPMNPNACSLLNLLHPCHGHRFRLTKSTPDLVLGGLALRVHVF
ncbi:hypothetical protein Hanom_Chr02g00130221 [Helianthus anomalus]